MFAENFKTATLKILNFFHVLLFNTEMGEGTKNFVRNFSYATVGNIGFTAFLFVVNIFAARVLGPEEYGKYALVLSAANFIIIPMLLGLHTSITKHLPEKRKVEAERHTIISSGFWGMTTLILVSSLIFVYLRDFWAKLLGISSSLFLYAILYSVWYSYKSLADAILKGLHRFKRQAILQIFYSVVIFVFFFAMYFFWDNRSYRIYTLAIIGGMAIYSLIVFVGNGRFMRPDLFVVARFKALLKYGLVITIVIATWAIIGNADRFFLNKFMDTRAVGIYAVYSSASMVVLGRFLSLFLIVFFPSASAVKNKPEIDRRLTRIIKVLFLPVQACNMLVLYLVLLIYGRDYPVDWWLILLFSLSAILATWVQIKGNLIVSEGIYAALFYGKMSVFGAMINLLANLILIKSFNAAGAVTASIITSLYFLFISNRYFKKLHPQANTGSTNMPE